MTSSSPTSTDPSLGEKRDNETAVTVVNAATRPEGAEALLPRVGQQPQGQSLAQLLPVLMRAPPEEERPAENPEQQGRDNHNEGMFAFQNVMDEIARNPPPLRHRQNAFQNEADEIMTAANEIMRDLQQLEDRQN